jgi:hypothetical protein
MYPHVARHRSDDYLGAACGDVFNDTAAVIALLRGEDIDVVSRDLGVSRW